MDNINDTLNMEIERVTDWLKLNKLSLNVQKTKAMLFHTSKKKVKTPQLKIDDSAIQFVEDFNLLGMILDSNLTWKKHLEMISNKISRTSGVLNRLKNYLPQHILLTLYNTLVLPHFNYDILLWGEKTARLEKLQKKLVRIISNSKFNSHTDPLFKRLRILKVTHLCALHELKFCFKLHHCFLP